MILPRVKTAKAVNLGVIFLLELGVLAGVWYWAWQSASGWGPLLGLAGAVVLAVLWGLFGSPRARFKVHGAARVVFETLWFGSGAVFWYAAGAHVWAIVFAVVGVVSKSLAHVWRQ